MTRKLRRSPGKITHKSSKSWNKKTHKCHTQLAYRAGSLQLPQISSDCDESSKVFDFTDQKKVFPVPTKLVWSEGRRVGYGNEMSNRETKASLKCLAVCTVPDAVKIKQPSQNPSRRCSHSSRESSAPKRPSSRETAEGVATAAVQGDLQPNTVI